MWIAKLIAFFVPFFATFWANILLLFAGIVNVLTVLLARLPLLIAAVAVFFLLWNVFVLAATTILSGIMPVIPDTITLVWGWVMPSNISELIIVMYSSRLVRFAFDIKFKVLQIKTS